MIGKVSESLECFYIMIFSLGFITELFEINLRILLATHFRGPVAEKYCTLDLCFDRNPSRHMSNCNLQRAYRIFHL